MYQFTIFTPTYNRAHTIRHTYESLRKQTYKNFEWIIIDDGSSDNTSEIVKSFIDDNEIEIKYIFQENQGKHIAQNKALEIGGELFLPLDSDDTILDNALEVMAKDWNDIPLEKRKLCSGLGYHCQNQNGEIIGDFYPEDGMVSNDLEMHFKYKVHGEKYGPIRTDIMKLFPNPPVKGHYFSESTVWFRIADRYFKIYFNKAVRVYEQHEDSVTVMGKKEQRYNLECKYDAELIYVNEFFNGWLKYEPVNSLKLVLKLVIHGSMLGKRVLFGCNSVINDVASFWIKVLIFVLAPFKLVAKCIL